MTPFSITKLIFLFVAITLLPAVTIAQCKTEPRPAEALSRVSGMTYNIEQPLHISYATEIAGLNEMSSGIKADFSFVKADNDGFFFLRTTARNFTEPIDYIKGDTIRFYLAGGKTIVARCYSDYMGLEEENIAFYRLSKSNLDDLATNSLDSIILNNHLHLLPGSGPSKKPDQTMVIRKFSGKNIKRVMENAGCLRGEMK